MDCTQHGQSSVYRQLLQLQRNDRFKRDISDTTETQSSSLSTITSANGGISPFAIIDSSSIIANVSLCCASEGSSRMSKLSSSK
mmetsp:Transcript_6534/g.12627  ORF Transcript_6534/g.12627 Transcript_6534/m.12627 type:complete len:84 (+) Transcript_6534:230-481(+)